MQSHINSSMLLLSDRVFGLFCSFFLYIRCCLSIHFQRCSLDILVVFFLLSFVEKVKKVAKNAVIYRNSVKKLSRVFISVAKCVCMYGVNLVYWHSLFMELYGHIEHLHELTANIWQTKIWFIFAVVLRFIWKKNQTNTNVHALIEINTHLLRLGSMLRRKIKKKKLCVLHRFFHLFWLLLSLCLSCKFLFSLSMKIPFLFYMNRRHLSKSRLWILSYFFNLCALWWNCQDQ